MAAQITTQRPLPNACNIKQNPVSQRQLACFCTTGCGSDRFKPGCLWNNLSPGSWVSCSSLLLWKKPSTRNWSLCLCCEGFHGRASSDSRWGWTQTSVLVRTLQVMSRTARVGGQHRLGPLVFTPGSTLHHPRGDKGFRGPASRGPDLAGVDHTPAAITVPVSSMLSDSEVLRPPMVRFLFGLKAYLGFCMCFPYLDFFSLLQPRGSLCRSICCF